MTKTSNKITIVRKAAAQASIVARQEIMANNKKRFVRVYKKHRRVADVCKSLRIVRGTYQAWMKADPDFNKTITDINEAYMDQVQFKLETAALDDIRAAQWYAERKMKHRGFSGEDPVPPREELTEEEIQERMEALLEERDSILEEREKLKKLYPDGKG